MLHQQELLAAKIARVRGRNARDSATRKLMDQRANDEESEDPRGNEGRKRRRAQSDWDTEQRRVRKSAPSPSSGNESSGYESVRSALPFAHDPKPARGRKQRRSSIEGRGYTSRSAKSRARLAELESEMEAEKANLARHQHSRDRAADDRQPQRRHQERRGRAEHRNARHSRKPDYMSESDSVEYTVLERGRGERRDRQRARPEQVRAEARGRKRARSSSDESDIDSHAFESDVSQDREGESSSSDEGEIPPPLCTHAQRTRHALALAPRGKSA